MKKIIELREEAGISQQKLSEILNVGQASVGRWEVNQQSITGENLKKLAIFFNVSADEILGLK